MKVNIHQKYYLRDGAIVPGVTTPLGVLAKPALIHWAWDLGCKGIDYRKYRDDKADIGILAHYLILCYFKNETPDYSDYTIKQRDRAENCLISFFEWLKNNPIEPILIEQSLVSEKYCYGGTIDLYGKINGKEWLVDFKTGKGIYEEMKYQVAAYRWLLIENGYRVEKARLLNIGRDENENFKDEPCGKLNKQFKIFLHCLSIYNLRKEINYD
ncbi:MAG TPA: hypothetical protein DCY12_08840 [Candidatus Atribacteria bacterium]|nr:hypothetical protein [Candidatus Atribacteria bacterium]